MTGTDDLDALICSLHQEPADEVCRLAVADLLEERGESLSAELVRLTVEVRHLPPEESEQRSEVESRVQSLLAKGVLPVVPEVVNSIGMRLALIPSGLFRMGSPETEQGRRQDELPHNVLISRPFYMGVFPVTQKQWQAVMGSNPSYFSREGEGAARITSLTEEEVRSLPVETVSWEDTQLFIERLNEANDGLVYRLPTEAEWEYCCRAGTLTAFNCGNSFSSAQANFDGKYPYGGAENGPHLRRTSVVGSYRPNAFGLYDTHGNVWEWCQDWYGPYQEGELVTEEAQEGDVSARVLRGGCWNVHGNYCRAAFRNGSTPSIRYRILGFRLAADPKGPEQGNCRVFRGGSWGSISLYCRAADRRRGTALNRCMDLGFRVAADPTE